MNKVTYILISVICFCAAGLLGAVETGNSGQFTVKQTDKGTYQAEFSAEDLAVKTVFPEKPAIENRTANLILQEPLVQMSVLVAEHQDADSENIIEMMMSIIGKEYANMGLQVVDAQKTEIKRDGPKTEQQYIVDLDNEIREFTTFNIYQNNQYDVIAMTRFILSPDEKDDLDLRTKGNDTAADFLKETTVEFKNSSD